MGKTALVIITKNSEELEVVTPINTLRRAEVQVIVAGLNSDAEVVLSQGVFMRPEKALSEVIASGAEFDAVILPGGRIGSMDFVESAEVGELLKEQERKGRLVAAICAAPKTFLKNNIFLGRALTSYPTSKDVLSEGNKYIYKEDRVVVDGNLITSRGPGTALEWSLAILSYLEGPAKAKEIAKIMLSYNEPLL